MRVRSIAMSMALLAAACSGGTKNSGGNGGNQAAEPNRAADKGTSEAQKKVRELDEGQRNIVLIRAIRDAGEDCQQVESSELMATSNNMPVYMANCAGGLVYAVVIRDDGTAAVRPAMREEGK
jgi:hypothetical protein